MGRAWRQKERLCHASSLRRMKRGLPPMMMTIAPVTHRLHTLVRWWTMVWRSHGWQWWWWWWWSDWCWSRWRRWWRAVVVITIVQHLQRTVPFLCSRWTEHAFLLAEISPTRIAFFARPIVKPDPPRPSLGLRRFFFFPDLKPELGSRSKVNPAYLYIISVLCRRKQSIVRVSSFLPSFFFHLRAPIGMEFFVSFDFQIGGKNRYAPPPRIFSRSCPNKVYIYIYIFRGAWIVAHFPIAVSRISIRPSNE